MAADLPPPPTPTSVDVLARLRATPAVSLVVGAAVLLVIGVVAWRAFGPQAAPVEMTLPRATPASTEQPLDGPAADGGTAYVHVAGAVVSPGVYRLGPSARVSDALDAAGGPAGDADVDALNLAAKVADGERVYVPRKGEAPAAVLAAGTSATGSKPAVLDLNTATAEQLEELPGVGPATALAIVEHRTERGRFRSVDDLLEVRGIGEAKLAAIRPKVRVA